MKERSAHTDLDALARDTLELVAEYHRCDDERERRVILLQMRDLAAQRHRHEAQAAELAGLPALWHAIYGEGRGYVALFAGQRRDGRLQHPHEGYFAYPDRLDDAIAWIRQAAAAEGDTYMCGHLVTQQRRRKETAAPLSALYVDLDHDRLDGQAVPMPGVIIQSSPGRLQCYWPLTAPVAPDEGEALNRQLAHALGADLSGWDLTQLLRVPGTTNAKYADRPLVTTLRADDTRYDPSVIGDHLAARPLVAPVARPREQADLTSDEPVRPLKALPLTATARRTVRGERPKRRPDGEIDRSASLVQIARVLAGAGVPPDQIARQLAERDQTLGWRKYSDRNDAQRQYARIAAYVTAPKKP